MTPSLLATAKVKIGLQVAATAALALGLAWAGLKSSESRFATLLCDTAITDGGVVESPSEFTAQIRGSDVVTKEQIDVEAVGLCKVTWLGPPFASSPLGAAVVIVPDKDAPSQGCACSDGSPGCERLDTLSGKWSAAPRNPDVMQPGLWRGTCVPVKICSVAEKMVSGVGAVNDRSFLSDPKCGGLGKVAPPLPVAVKAAQAEVPIK